MALNATAGVTAVLPLVLSESSVFVFKFWFNGELRDGMCHRNELFCRLRTFDAKERAKVYHLGCKLAQQYQLIALTSADMECSLWVSLRDPHVESILQQSCDLELPQISIDRIPATFTRPSDALSDALVDH